MLEPERKMRKIMKNKVCDLHSPTKVEFTKKADEYTVNLDKEK